MAGIEIDWNKRSLKDWLKKEEKLIWDDAIKEQKKSKNFTNLGLKRKKR